MMLEHFTIQENWQQLFNLRYQHGWREPSWSTVCQVEFIISALGLRPAYRILDAGCGAGRHLFELARRGFRQLQGIDAADQPLLSARTQSQAEGLKITFTLGDLRTISPVEAGHLDAIYCLDFTFGLLDDTDNDRLLKRMASWLKPGGLLLMEVFHAGDLSSFVGRNEYEILVGRCEIEGTLLPEQRRLQFRGMWQDMSGRHVYPDQCIRVYKRTELEYMANNHGLSWVRAYASSVEPATAANSFVIDSPTLNVVLQRKI